MHGFQLFLRYLL